jgi:hypothetical protein
MKEIKSDWYRQILSEATDVINEYENKNLGENPSALFIEGKTKLFEFYGSKEDAVNAWYSVKASGNFRDEALINRQIVYAYLSKYQFNWEKLKGKDRNNIINYLEDNLRNSPTVKDLRLWFNACRAIKSNDILIENLEHLDFLQETPETAYYLMSLYALGAIQGSKIYSEKYYEYKQKCFQKENFHNSRIFCPEWLGVLEGKTNLVKFNQIGEWDREISFFKSPKLNNLKRVKGIVSKHISKTQGFIEIENSGIEVFYQPQKFNHYSSDVNKTKVELYVGFNYDGARGFQIKNL